MTERRIGRIIAVTALLAALGGVAGGAGGLLIVAVLAFLSGPGTADLLFALEIGSTIGFVTSRRPMWRSASPMITLLAASCASYDRC